MDINESTDRHVADLTTLSPRGLFFQSGFVTKVTLLDREKGQKVTGDDLPSKVVVTHK